MPCIVVRAFESPSIKVGEKTVVFPLKKAEALFYYLLVHGRATRDELAALLWGDLDDKSARRNLRDVLYHLRRELGEEILELTGQQSVGLRPGTEIVSDLRNFLSNPETQPELYSGEFLKGFNLKDAPEFEEWLLARREEYRGLYIRVLERRMERAIGDGEPEAAAGWAERLLRVDGYNEEASRVLMQSYALRGAYGKAINVYQQLQEVLSRELGIAPDIQSRKLFEQIVEDYNQRERDAARVTGAFFYGRQAELQELARNYDAFLTGREFRSVLILGEMGVGKTWLTERFLASTRPGPLVLAANCHPAEQAFVLKPWDRIFERLRDIIRERKIEIPLLWRRLAGEWFPALCETGTEAQLPEPSGTVKYHMVENAVLSIIQKVAQRGKLVLHFEDIQWMDGMSLGLLSGLLAADNRGSVLLCGTARSGYGSELERFLLPLVRQGLLTRMPLARFTDAESCDFVAKALSERKPDEKTCLAICREAEGIAFFLAEYVEAFRRHGNLAATSGKIKDILESRLIDLADEDRKLLDIAAIFFDEVSAAMLQTLSGRSALTVLDSLDRLTHKQILKEAGDGWVFGHQKLRDYIYQNQSRTKRRMLHNNVAQILEAQLHGDEQDGGLYPRLIHHHGEAGNKVAALRYSILHIKRYLDVSDELFPEWRTGRTGPPPHIVRAQAEEWIERIDGELAGLSQEQAEAAEVLGLKVLFLHMKGRYRIREGDYEEGTAAIEGLLAVAGKLGDTYYLLQGYKELVYYAIRVNDLPRMTAVLKQALPVARHWQDPTETGILLRLMGLYHILAGDYPAAEKLLGEAVELLTGTEEQARRNALNIAACHSYLGDIRRDRREYGAALAYYRQAIALSETALGTQSLAIFHNNAGQAAYLMADWSLARCHFEKAIEIYCLLDAGWGRSIAEGYMALLCCRSREYAPAVAFLTSAELHALKSRNPRELARIAQVKADIRNAMEKDDLLRREFAQMLPRSAADYRQEAEAASKQK